MGIVNVTPDSFAESTRTFDPEAAIEAALRAEDDGADIVDIGAESTRPGAPPVDADEERRRLLPVVRGLAGRIRIPISVDTYKADVAREALRDGAAMVNDVSGLQRDAALADVVAQAGAALVLTHTRGTSADMYARAHYADLVAEVTSELRTSVQSAVERGVPLDAVLVDPGIGFAKRPEHSYGVLARLPEIAAALGRPLVAGPSRKSFLRAASGDRDAPDRDWATAAAVTAAVLGGAHIVRVHAVAEMIQVIRTAEEIRRMVHRP
ncbi:MAG TPA: dihydropteroate synthase [Vicinamibacterales bacterium]|nr:dihydropteroate synthase [Vicinamibacterales bacterium]